MASGNDRYEGKTSEQEDPGGYWDEYYVVEAGCLCCE